MKRFAFLCFLFAAAAAPAASTNTVRIVVGALDSFAAAGHSDTNGSWRVPEGAAPVLSVTNGARRLAFVLKAGEGLEYHPAPPEGSAENGLAEVVVSNAALSVAASLPANANPAHQASITAAKPAGEETAAYYGWAGEMTNGAPVWIRLDGAVPAGDGAEVDVGFSFDYRGAPATVSYRIGGAVLHAATNAQQTVFPLATKHRKVNYLVFTGAGSIGDLSGVVAVFVLDPSAVEPGQDLAAGDGPAVEMQADGFVVRFRTHDAGVAYALLSSPDLAAGDDAWTEVPGASASSTAEAIAASGGKGQLIELVATPLDAKAGAMFYKIRARR